MPVTAPDIYSLLPVLLALFISISLRNVIVVLFTGLFAGVLMIEGPALLGGVYVTTPEVALLDPRGRSVMYICMYA